MSVRSTVARLAAVTSTAVALSLLPAAPSQALVPSTPDAGTPDFDGEIFTITHKGDVTYVGGKFTQVNDGSGPVARRNAAAFNTETGDLLPWNPRPGGPVFDIAITGDQAFIGGRFGKVGNKVRHNFARVNTAGGKSPRGFVPNVRGEVHAIDITPRTVYIGGDFDRVNNKARMRLASFSRTGALKPWAPQAMGGTVHDLEYKRVGVYVAGQFNRLNGKRKAANLALVRKARKGALLTGFDPLVYRIIFDIHVTANNVYAAAGGVGGLGMSFVRRNGATQWARQFDGDVQAVTVMKGSDVYFGGHYFNLCDTRAVDAQNGDCQQGQTSRRRGASFDLAGNLTGWDPQLNGQKGVNALDATGAAERLAVGGDFSAANRGANPRDRIAIFE